MIDLPSKSYRILSYLVISLRIILPLFILVNPFVMPIIYQLLDALDYSFIMNSKIMKKGTYQKLDKFLDFYYLFTMFLVSIYWSNPILIGLFIYRAIGFMTVLISKKRIFFVIFNNTFEWMYNIFSYGYVYSDRFLNEVNENIIYILPIVFVVKMIPELYIHYFNKDSLFFVSGLVKKKV